MDSFTEAVLAQRTLEVVQQTEKKLDAELAKYSLSNTDDLEALRRNRLQELKNRADKEATWRRQGHGSYSEVADQKEWFEISKSSERVVTHFYRSTTWRCEVMDKHLTQLAGRHLETRFIKIDAEKAPFLAERLSVVLLPTLVMTKDNFTADRIEGFDELGGRDDFATEVLEARLAQNGLIEYESPNMGVGAPGKKAAVKQSVKSNPTGKAIYGQRRMIDSEDEAEED